MIINEEDLFSSKLFEITNYGFDQYQGSPRMCEFSAFRHFFKTNVAQSVAELILYSQKTRNVVIFYKR